MFAVSRAFPLAVVRFGAGTYAGVAGEAWGYIAFIEAIGTAPVLRGRSWGKMRGRPVVLRFLVWFGVDYGFEIHNGPGCCAVVTCRSLTRGKGG